MRRCGWLSRDPVRCLSTGVMIRPDPTCPPASQLQWCLLGLNFACPRLPHPSSAMPRPRVVALCHMRHAQHPGSDPVRQVWLPASSSRPCMSVRLWRGPRRFSWVSFGHGPCSLRTPRPHHPSRHVCFDSAWRLWHSMVGPSRSPVSRAQRCSLRLFMDGRCQLWGSCNSVCAPILVSEGEWLI